MCWAISVVTEHAHQPGLGEAAPDDAAPLWGEEDRGLQGPSHRTLLGLPEPREPWSRRSSPTVSPPSPPPSPSHLLNSSCFRTPEGKPKHTGVGSLSLLQRIFPTQESNRSSSALQVDSLPTRLSEKPVNQLYVSKG